MRLRPIIVMLFCISLGQISTAVQGQTGVTVPSTDTNARPAKQRGKANTNYQVRGPKVSMAAQPQTGRSLVIPATDSSVTREGEAALLAAPENVTDASKVFAHTNYIVLSNLGIRPLAVGTPPAGETPDSIRSVYNIGPNGGSRLIAIVDAFDYPTADADLGKFS